MLIAQDDPKQITPQNKINPITEELQNFKDIYGPHISEKPEMIILIKLHWIKKVILLLADMQPQIIAVNINSYQKQNNGGTIFILLSFIHI